MFQSTRKAELARRGADCSEYRDTANAPASAQLTYYIAAAFDDYNEVFVGTGVGGRDGNAVISFSSEGCITVSLIIS